MSRPKKVGLDFYYKSVHDYYDIPVQELMAKYGATGYLVKEIATSLIYREGYYLEMPVNRLAAYICRNITGSCQETVGEVEEILRYCGEIGIFDQALLNQSVLTSREIQEHYACVTARRKADKTKYWLLSESDQAPTEEATHAADPSPSENEQIMNEANPDAFKNEQIINAAICTQTKENKSKVNQTKQNQTNSTQIKQKQSKRASANELFHYAEPAFARNVPDWSDDDDDEINGEQREIAYDDAFEDGYADAGCETENESFADYDDDGYYDDDENHRDYRDYGAIERAFRRAVGRDLSDADKECIDILRREGASDSLIVTAIGKCAARRPKGAIHSFRYFLPMIRDNLRCGVEKEAYFHNEYAPQKDRYLLGGMTLDGPYAGCTTDEEFIAVLKAEEKAHMCGG